MDCSRADNSGNTQCFVDTRVRHPVYLLRFQTLRKANFPLIIRAVYFRQGATPKGWPM